MFSWFYAATATRIEEQQNVRNNRQKQGGGRLQPGCSGNPAGRPKGARNRATLLAAERLEAHIGAVLGQQLERALADGQVSPREAEPVMKYLDALGDALRHQPAMAARAETRAVKAEAVQVEMGRWLETAPGAFAVGAPVNAARPAEVDVEKNREIQVEPVPPARSPCGSTIVPLDADRVAVGRDCQSGSGGRTSVGTGAGSAPSAFSLSA